MTNPVPDYKVSTPYGKRGSHWSCDENSAGNGIHTGADFAAPAGTTVVAARGGTVVHCSHGSAFGNHQLEVLPGDGTRDFYAHMRSRVADGTDLDAGEKVGEVGSEGNATGPHLHFERHKVATGGWSCNIVVNPQPSLESETDMALSDDDIEKIAKRVNQVLGDYDAAGNPREGFGGKGEPEPKQADKRLRQIDNRT
jgi:murein DD-endopeptidase MepM/ murein hydrolase activator NlpD